MCQFKIAEAVPNHDAQQWLTVGVSSEPVEDQTRSRLTAATPLRTVVRANLKSIYQHAIGCKLHLEVPMYHHHVDGAHQSGTHALLVCHDNDVRSPCRSFFNARAAPGNHSNCRQFRT